MTHIAETKTEVRGGSSIHRKPQRQVVRAGFEPGLQRCRAGTHRTPYPVTFSCHTVYRYTGARGILVCLLIFFLIILVITLPPSHWPRSLFSFGKAVLTWWPSDLDLIAPFSNPGVFKQLEPPSFEPGCFVIRQTFNKKWRFSECSRTGRGVFRGR